MTRGRRARKRRRIAHHGWVAGPGARENFGTARGVPCGFVAWDFARKSPRMGMFDDLAMGIITIISSERGERHGEGVGD